MSGNALRGQQSRYLLQHAEDPVNWQCWSAEALAEARAANKPILLSVGYSACHWCQQMQSESFSDPTIASLMNATFVSIKVDREERPDLDDVYQTAHQLLNGQSGGWPLTAFLCPKTLMPFVIGTYFPRLPSHGRIPFKDLLIRVEEFYRKQSKEFQNLRDQMARSFKVLNELPSSDAPELADLYLLHEASRRLLEAADREYGGFKGAPKFAMPYALWRLLETVSEGGELAESASDHLKLTLDRLGGSAIHDGVDGGFFRYTTDEAWREPHFEKMLFDNAALIGLFAAASSILHEPLYSFVALHTTTWVRRALYVEGGYAASLDATTGDGDGTTYMFSRQEIRKALDPDEYKFMDALYGLERISGERFLLHCVRSPVEAAVRLRIDIPSSRQLYESAIEKLRMLRYQKPLPARDEKVLCAWNALLVKSLAQLTRYSGDIVPVRYAQQLVDKLVESHWYNKRLFSIVYRNGERLPAFLDDYGFLLLALLDLLRVSWRDKDYELARHLAEGLINHFEDSDVGGFFMVANDQDDIPFKPKSFADTMTPSGNGVAALALLRFGYLSAEPRYVEAARRCVEFAMPLLRRQPEAHYTLLQAMRELLLPKPVVLLLGDESMQHWQSAIQARFRDQVACYRVPANSELHPPEVMIMDNNSAKICRAELCEDDVHQLEPLMAQLERILTPETPEVASA